MPLLFSVGQHAALGAVHKQLAPGEHLLAFLDDVYMVTKLDRVGFVHATVQEELRAHAKIQING